MEPKRMGWLIPLIAALTVAGCSNFDRKSNCHETEIEAAVTIADCLFTPVKRDLT